MKKPKPKALRPIKPNAGVEAWYYKQIKRLIDEMSNSVEYWLAAEFKKSPPRMTKVVNSALAQDAGPADRIRKIMRDLSKRWISKFDEAAPKIAEAYLRDSFKSTDSAFMKALKDAGWTVQFKMTPPVRDAFAASLAENVGLIKSIPQEYLQKIEGAVMRTYSAGRDLQALTAAIREIHPVTQRRAQFIARDQSNKANAIVSRARSLELGITDGLWMHSHAGKHPRADHLAANGKQYRIAEGCLISGEFIQPGELPNCRCTYRAVLPI